MDNKTKPYYSVCTGKEKVWIYADESEVVDGCLTFYDFDTGMGRILVASFAANYWLYVYEADPDTGESLPEQIPFWKKHTYAPR